MMLGSEPGPMKARHGSPCNGCGWCCAMKPCGVANDLLSQTEGPCRALEPHEGAFRCGLMVRPSRYLDTPESGDSFLGGIIAEALGAGRGCDSDDPT